MRKKKNIINIIVNIFSYPLFGLERGKSLNGVVIVIISKLISCGNCILYHYWEIVEYVLIAIERKEIL